MPQRDSFEFIKGGAKADITILYLRKDLLKDGDNREHFRQRFKRELSAPETWAE